MRTPKSAHIDNGVQNVIDSVISFWGATTANGNIGGTTIVCDMLANEPSYAGHQAAIISPNVTAWGQAMPIDTHVGNTLTVRYGFTTPAGAPAQIMQGTIFVVLKESWGLDFAALIAILGAFSTLQETGGILAASGAQDTVILVNAPAGVFWPHKVQIDLTNMVGGDATTIRLFYRIALAGALLLKDLVTYQGAQVPPLINVELEPNRFGFHVTLEQTAGPLKNYGWAYFFES